METKRNQSPKWLVVGLFEGFNAPAFATLLESAILCEQNVTSEDPAWKALLLSFTIYMDFLRLAVGKSVETWGKDGFRQYGKIGLQSFSSW